MTVQLNTSFRDILGPCVADQYRPAMSDGDSSSWVFNGTPVELDPTLRPERNDYGTDALDVSLIRVANPDGTIESDLYFGDLVLDPAQWLAPSESAAIAVLKAGLATAPIPTIDNVEEARRTAAGLLLAIAAHENGMGE